MKRRIVTEDDRLLAAWAEMHPDHREDPVDQRHGRRAKFRNQGSSAGAMQAATNAGQFEMEE